MIAETLPVVAAAATAAAQTIYRELSADLETPTSVYLKLRGAGPSFLLESVEGGERVARYSFIGVEPSAQYRLQADAIERHGPEGVTRLPLAAGQDALHVLQAELGRYQTAHIEGLPRFVGGLVGYLGYEAVRQFEPKLAPLPTHPDRPQGIFLLADTLAAFDHARRSLFLITHAFDGDTAAAERRLDALERRLAGPIPEEAPLSAAHKPETTSNLTQADYEAMVAAAREHIAAGDIFQVVLSQRLSRQTTARPFDIYRALRRLNPSPYMFFFEFGEVAGEPFYLLGASPEIFVRLEGRRASLRPIAGTRPRGANAAEDAALEADLRADPKERAEHVMLVDLGRNDLGRVSQYGTVRVTDSFTVERYSHVMHLVSHVEGDLWPGLTAFDLVRAAFPAGTVSGAPKVRAMEIIGELEQGARGCYAGAVGYFSFDGAMDTCLAIRTLVGHGPTVSVQAGAGIVADSVPAREFDETMNKARAALRAVEIAEG
ncbi:MAG: anthranilate synthase component I [Anaerolineales bacterium]|nr:anthranilate synthase component I [Anaerolineales bacterium]